MKLLCILLCFVLVADAWAYRDPSMCGRVYVRRVMRLARRGGGIARVPVGCRVLKLPTDFHNEPDVDGRSVIIRTSTGERLVTLLSIEEVGP